MHVTLKVRKHVFNLRSRRCFQVVIVALLAAKATEDFRIVGVTVQRNHLHLLIEAARKAALAAGVRSLKIALAKGLNEVMGSTGPVFTERYNGHVLRTPTEARATIRYVRRNTAKHAAQRGHKLSPSFRDPNTFGYFGDEVLLPSDTAHLVAPPQSWLLREGWKLVSARRENKAKQARANRLSRKTVAPDLTTLPLFAPRNNSVGSAPQALPFGGSNESRHAA